MGKNFIYGTQYWRPPTPPYKDWKTDIERIKKTGFNLIKIWLIWRWHERTEGSFCWEDSDKIFALCKKHGILINANIIMDYAPEWAFRKYDCYKYGPNGEKLFRGGSGWFPISGCWPCYDNDEFRKAGENFIKTLTDRYKDAVSLHSWDVWNEPKNMPVDDCFCIYSKDKYRKWLKDKYGTINEYNHVFGKAWGNFDEIEPPGEIKDYTEMLNWKEWAMAKVAGQLKWVKDIVCSVDSRHPVLSHAGMCSVLTNIVNTTTDDFANAKVLDFYGSSLPCQSKKEIIQGRVGLVCDWIRSVSPYFWINEIYPRLPNWGRAFGKIEDKQISPAELKFMVWEAIARGAKGILYWQYKNERMGCESDGFGLVGIDGENTEHLKIASDIGKTVMQNESLFFNARREQAQVALLYDYRSDIVSNIEDFDYFKGSNYCYKKSLLGNNAVFWRTDIAVDYLDIRDLEKISRYKLIYLTMPIIMDCRTAEILKNYIEAGGTVISEAFLGAREANTWVSLLIPNCGLDKVFGVREKQQRISSEVKNMTVNGVTFKTGRVSAGLFPSTAEVIGKWDNGEVSATVSSYGRGKAILLGASLGISFLEGGDPGICRVLAELAENAGITHGIKIKNSRGLIKLEELTVPDASILFVFNYEDYCQEITLDGLNSTEAQELTGNAEIDTSSALTINIPANEIAVIKLIKSIV